MRTEVDELLSYGCPRETINYLGDGVYAGTANNQTWLCCRRDHGFACIAIDETTFAALQRYMKEHN